MRRQAEEAHVDARVLRLGRPAAAAVGARLEREPLCVLRRDKGAHHLYVAQHVELLAVAGRVFYMFVLVFGVMCGQLASAF